MTQDQGDNILLIITFSASAVASACVLIMFCWMLRKMESFESRLSFLEGGPNIFRDNRNLRQNQGEENQELIEPRVN